MNLNDQFVLHTLDGHIEQLYVVEYKHKILLLDGGSRSDAQLIEHFILDELKRTMLEVKLCVISHGHPDHAAGAQLLRTKYEIPIAAAHNIDEWYDGVGGYVQHKLDTLVAQFIARKNKKDWERMDYSRTISPDFRLRDNESLPFFPDWQVLETPGHTTHDISIYHSNTKILYVADLIICIRQKFLLPFPVTMPQLMRDSLDRIAKLPIAQLLLAHGGIFYIDNIDLLIAELISQINNELKINFRLMQPLTRFSPSIKKHKNSS